jgi:hypothetical protein
VSINAKTNARQERETARRQQNILTPFLSGLCALSHVCFLREHALLFIIRIKQHIVSGNKLDVMPDSA